jgi:SAM-dependent methyltransferase
VVEAPPDARIAGRRTYAGLFLVTLATLLDEILLTRIFSVATWYHFAFLAISIAMLGMTMGAMAVGVFGGRFSEERTRRHLALSALLFAGTLGLGFLVQIRIPFSTDLSAVALAGDAAIFLLATVPFACSGVCVCLALTRFPRQVGRLYAVDLTGAAVACVAVIYLLKITDGPTAVIVAAAVAAFGAIGFALDAGDARLVRAAVAAAAVLSGAAAIHTVLVWNQRPIVRLRSVKGTVEERPLYEKWNSFSRIRVRPSPTASPLGWGLSQAFRPRHDVRQLILDIDGGASTVLTGFDGNLEAVEHLRYDITSLPHVLRPDARVLVIGAGGGRDILAALVFGQRSVVGVEINEEILRAVTGRFGEFTGHLERDPRVLLVNDEARSYVARQRGRYDIIQASLIDTSAATAAGAFVLTENSIYTLEAWKVFLDHLAPRGVLAFSWFYFSGRPAEMYRLTALAGEALRRRGVADVRGHILLARHRTAAKSVGTLLVSPDPFSPQDLAALETTAGALKFEVVLAPGTTVDPVFAQVAAGTRPGVIGEGLPLRVDPPTDDAPFFFNMLRLRDAFRYLAGMRAGIPGADEPGSVGGNLRAVVLLCVLLAAVVTLTLVALAVPILLAARRADRRGAIPYLLYFACIGLGFMLVEISQVQRLIIFLGHPTYGLSVVLFSLLLAGGAGSLSTRSSGAADAGRGAGVGRLAALPVILLLFGGTTPRVIEAFASSGTPVRILVSVALLLPIGFVMGMAFPAGMSAAEGRFPGMSAWFWGVNGAASVCASVVATATALSFGIAAAFWSGCGCYVLALLAYAAAKKRAGGRSAGPTPCRGT